MAPPLDRFEWERLIRELPLSLAEKCTAYALATFVNPDGTNAHPGIDRLVRATGSSKSTVLRALESLEGMGFIKRPGKIGGKGLPRGYATVWDLAVPDAATLWITPRSGVVVTPDRESLARLTGVTVTLIRCHPDTPQLHVPLF